MSEDRKSYAGKNRLDLVPLQGLEQAGCAMTVGLAKHGAPNTWQKGEKAAYIGAALRHLSKYVVSILAGGKGIDPETGLSHLAGLSATVAILCWFEDQEGNLPAVLEYRPLKRHPLTDEEAETLQNPPLPVEGARPAETRLEKARRLAEPLGWKIEESQVCSVVYWRIVYDGGIDCAWVSPVAVEAAIEAALYRMPSKLGQMGLADFSAPDSTAEPGPDGSP